MSYDIDFERAVGVGPTCGDAIRTLGLPALDAAMQDDVRTMLASDGMAVAGFGDTAARGVGGTAMRVFDDGCSDAEGGGKNRESAASAVDVVVRTRCRSYACRSSARSTSATREHAADADVAVARPEECSRDRRRCARRSASSRTT